MSKPQEPISEQIEFIEFWCYIAHELGSSRLTINHSASSIHKLIDCNSDSKEYLRQAIKESYKQSHCSHLRAPINIEAVLDILGETAYALRGDQRDDLFDIELLEEIAWYINSRYSHCITIKQHKPERTCKKARLISFPNYKIRHANARL